MSLQPEPNVTFESVGAKFAADGFIIVRSVWDASSLASLRNACEELCTTAARLENDAFISGAFFDLNRTVEPLANDRVAEIEPGILRRVTYPYLVSEPVNRLRCHDHLLEIVRSLLGPNLRQIVNQINFNHPGSGRGWGWHRDSAFRKPGVSDLASSFVQTITAIDRSSSVNGGLGIVPGSHRDGTSTNDITKPLRTVKVADEDPEAAAVLTPSLEPGDVLIFSPFLLHGSTPNLSLDPRRVFINGYAISENCQHGIVCMREGRPEYQVAEDAYMEYERDHSSWSKIPGAENLLAAS